MAISNAETKENLVRKSNQRVIDAEKAANAKRASLQEKLNTLVKDFKSEFKVTTVDEDYAAQLKVLEASYQARKEMAEKTILIRQNWTVPTLELRNNLNPNINNVSSPFVTSMAYLHSRNGSMRNWNSSGSHVNSSF